MLVVAAGACLALVPILGVAALAMALTTILRAGIRALAARAVHGLSTPIWSNAAASGAG